MQRRDFLLIPLISLLTVVTMTLGLEVAARHLFEKGGKEACGQRDDLHGTRLQANCTARAKSPEGPWVEYRFNECGYRNDESCGPLPAGHMRVALLGASTAQGYKVPYEQTLAVRAAAELSSACHRSTEFQNMGVAGYSVINHYWRLDEALALKPQAVVLVLSAYELVQQTAPQVLARRKFPEEIAQSRGSGGAAAGSKRFDLIVELDSLMANSRAVLAAQHYLYQDRARYIDLFLMHRDKADYLRVPMPVAWERRLADLELMLGEMAEKSRGQGVPLVLLFGPQRVQAALLDGSLRPPAVDPHAISRRVGEIARRTGVVMVDVLTDMTELPQPQQLFYPVDGHMTGEGHAVLARSLVRQLLVQRVGAFASCGVDAQPQLKP